MRRASAGFPRVRARSRFALHPVRAQPQVGIGGAADRGRAPPQSATWSTASRPTPRKSRDRSLVNVRDTQALLLLLRSRCAARAPLERVARTHLHLAHVSRARGLLVAALRHRLTRRAWLPKWLPAAALWSAYPRGRRAAHPAPTAGGSRLPCVLAGSARAAAPSRAAMGAARGRDPYAATAPWSSVG